MPYAVHTVACLLDNYAYIVVDLSGRPPHPVALVDPCESKAVLRALERLSQARRTRRAAASKAAPSST